MDEVVREKKPNKSLKYTLSILFLLVLIIITCIVIFKDYSIKELKDIIIGLKLRYLAIALMMPPLYIFFEGCSTTRILKKLNEKTNLGNNILYAGIDQYFCAITPCALGGQPMSVYYMSQDNIKTSKSILALLVNTAMFRLVLVTLSILSIIFSHNIIFSTNASLPILFFIGITFNIGFAIFCFLGIYATNVIKRIGRWFLKKINRFRKKNIEDVLEKFDKTMEEYRLCGEFIKKHPIITFESFVFNCLQRLSYFMIAYFVYRAFGLSQASIVSLISVQVIVACSVDSLPIPGGVLLSETLFTLAYTEFYTSELKLPAMIITRLCSYYFLLIVGFILVLTNVIKLYIIKYRRNRKTITEELNKEKI